MLYLMTNIVIIILFVIVRAVYLIILERKILVYLQFRKNSNKVVGLL